MRPESLWIATTPETRYPRLDGTLEVDVVVVGAGLVGLTAATLLARDGARVAVVEARALACGTTGNTTAKVTALHSLVYADLREALGAERAQHYADANRAGVGTIARLANELGINCELRRLPSDTWTSDEGRRDELEEEVEAARAAGLPVEIVEDGLPFGARLAVRLSDQIAFHPRRYCLGLADALAGSVQIFEWTRVHAAHEAEGHVELEADGGSIRADWAILATLLPFPKAGAWFARLHASRSYAIAVALDGPAPEGMTISIDEPVVSVRPHLGPDPHAIVEGGEHKVGEGGDTRRYHEALEAWARAHLPVREVTHRWSAQDYMSPDRVPFVGPIAPGAQRILVATGFSKWGMSNGTAAALMLSDIVAGRPSPWLELFGSERIGGAAGVGTVLREGAATAKHLVADRLTGTTIDSVEDLAPGEAGLLDTEDGLTAAARDADGLVLAVSAVCTHLGCIVGWNATERSWDCPCHGSRFGTDGSVLEGPATTPLEHRRP